MNIYTKPGATVVFDSPESAFAQEQERARKYLLEGEKYTVEKTEVGGFHTTVFLKEHPDCRFNSCQFSDA